MTTTATSLQTDGHRIANQPQAASGLAIVRVTIGAMFVWVFFENLEKGLYRPAGYAGLIDYYIKNSHSPAAWKAVMGLAANHAAMAAPMQGLTEISLAILLVIGLLTRPAAFVALLHLNSKVLAAVLLGFADLPIQRIPDLTPAAWVAWHS